MSELDHAMLKRMEYLVESEHRPFTYFDFLSFEVDGKQYKMSHGTFRNKISKLVKSGKVELSCNSGIGFYNLRGHKVGKAMTRNHTEVSHKTKAIESMMMDLPLGNQCIHNIRLRLKVPGLWSALSSNHLLEKKANSHDISLDEWNRENSVIKFTIHKTDTVSLTISCSQTPISLDSDGIIRLFSILSRAEELIRNFVTENLKDKKILQCIIPDYKKWTVTMWHFGRDSFVEYTGEKFSITIEQAQGIMTRIYSKDLKRGKRKIRLEIQEYPRKSISEAIQEKILISTT